MIHFSNLPELLVIFPSIFLLEEEYISQLFARQMRMCRSRDGLLLHALLVEARGPQGSVSTHSLGVLLDMLKVCCLNLLLGSRLLWVLGFWAGLWLHFVVVLVEEVGLELGYPVDIVI